MQKQKRSMGEIVKTAAMSLALVGVFGMALVGANHLAFANATSRTIEIPPFEAMSSTQTLNASATSYTIGVSVANALSAQQPRNLIVKDTIFHGWRGMESGDGTVNENALSAEEAAQIGAQYIYEFFGECVDGATVQMTFNGHLRHRGTLGVWSGTVGDGIVPEDFPVEVDFPIGTPMFLFMLNAETGEAIHVERMTDFGDGVIMLTPRSDARITMDISYNVRGFGWDAENRLWDAGYHREFHFWENFDPDELGIIWEIPNPDSIWQIDDLDEFLQGIVESGGSIIRRFITPAVPGNLQPHEYNSGNERDI